MTAPIYQTANPATMPPGLEVDTETSGGAERQVVIVRNPADNTPLKNEIVDADGNIATVHSIDTNVTGGEYGVVTNAIIHGKTTGGGGGWVDVKVNPSGALTVEATAGGTFPVSDADDFNHDAFGRDRVSNPANRFDVEFTYDLQPLIMEAISAGSASIVHQSATRDALMTVGATSTASSADFVGHYYVPYTPGNSQLVEITGTLDGANAGGNVSFFVMNNGSTTIYTSTQWTGSVAGIDWSKSQIFAADFQSLKVGRIRMGLFRSGVFVELLEVLNDNVRKNGFWQYPNQPVHWRIYNTTSNSVSELGYFGNNNGFGWRFTTALSTGHNLAAICATVKSEGGEGIFDMAGFPFAISNGATTKTVSNTLIPVLSIQMSTAFNSLTNRSLVIPLDLSFVSDQSFYYEVRLNPTLSTASWVAVSSSYSAINYDVSATAVTGGITIATGYGGTGGTRTGGVKTGFTGRAPLSLNYPATAGDILSICAIRVGPSNAATGAALEWKEIR